MKHQTITRQWIPINEWMPTNHVNVDGLWILHRGFVSTTVYWDALGQFWRYADGQVFQKQLHYIAQIVQHAEMPKVNSFGGANHEHQQVLQSAAGFYIGCLHYDSVVGCYVPGERNSAAYWADRREAEKAMLANNFEFNF